MSREPIRRGDARLTPRRGIGGSNAGGWTRRLASSLLALVFLAIHHIYTPLHLVAEDHLHAHGDRHAACADAPRASIDGGAKSTHEPHPASDHSLTSAIPRSLAQLDLVPGLEAPRLVVPLDPEPRTRPAPVPLLRPRPPPPFSCRPRAPPAA